MSDHTPERKPWKSLPALLGLVAFFALNPAVRAAAAEGGKVGDSDDRSSYVLVSGGSVITLSDSSLDVNQTGRRGKADGDLLRARREDKTWVVRDARLLAQAHNLLDPLQKLGERQGELGEQQGELGEQQGELGEKQGEIGEHQGELGERQAALKADIAQQAASGKRTEHLEERLLEIKAKQRQLGAQQAELGRRQAELGQKQSELGTRQAELGRQQAELAERVQAELGALLDEAIRKGLAQEVKK